MTQKHKHYDAIIAFANGKKIESRIPGHAEWDEVPNPSWYDNWEYRVKTEPVVDYTIVFMNNVAGSIYKPSKDEVIDVYGSHLTIQGFLKRKTIDGKVVSFEFLPL